MASGAPAKDAAFTNVNVEQIVAGNRLRIRAFQGLFDRMLSAECDCPPVDNIRAETVRTTHLNANSIVADDINATNLKANSIIADDITAKSLMATDFNTENISTTNLQVAKTLKLPFVDTTIEPPLAEGTIVYDFVLDNIRISTGTNWIEAGGSFTLPPSLQSIAGLSTVGNEMLFTVATDIYATLPTSSLGRAWLNLNSVASQQNSLGLTIGGTVQAHSDVLSDLVTNAGTTNNFLFSNGVGYAVSPCTTFGRSLLNYANSSTLNLALGTLTGSGISTADRLLRVTGGPGQEVAESSTASLDALGNLTGINDLSVAGDLSLTGNLDGISPSERAQLANINGTTISTTQWGYLGAMNQLVDTGSTPQFQGLNVNNQKILNLGTPTNAQDAATKQYVDTVASSGAPPLTQVRFATAAILSNAPVYASPAQTLTATVAGALTVDGASPAVGDRILVKNQVDSRENGVYVVTDDGSTPGPMYVLTRASDMNQAAMPIAAGTSVFVDITGTAVSNDATTWALQTTINNVDPLTDLVNFVQTGGNQVFTAGQGIQIVGSSIQVDNTARFLYSGNSLELNTVGVPYGGTGNTTLASNGVLIGNGTSAVDDSKLAPVGDFVGTSDMQTLTNKTIDSTTNTVRATSLATTGSPVVVSAAVPPVAGQTLVASSATAAAWQTPSSSSFAPDRTLFVYQGAPDVTPNFSTVQGAITQAISLTPSASNAVAILMFPGTYAESIPITVPEHVSIATNILAQGQIIITPNSGMAQPIMVLSGNTRISGLYLDGLGTATVGIQASTNIGSTDVIYSTTVVNCTTTGFFIAGSGAPYSRIVVCYDVLARAIVSPMINGFEVSAGAILAGTNFNATAFAGGGGSLTNGYNVYGDYTIMDCSNVQASSCSVGVTIGPKTATNTQNFYPKARLVGVNLGFIASTGLYMKEGSVGRFSDFRVDDSFAPVPVHIRVDNPNSGDPNFLGALWMNIRYDKFMPNGNGGLVVPQIFGSDLSEIPGDIENKFSGRLTVGLPNVGSATQMGQGGNHTIRMLVFVLDASAGTSTDITLDVDGQTPGTSALAFPAAPAVNDALYIASMPLTSGKFPGIFVEFLTGIVSTSGVTQDVLWEYWNGATWTALYLMSRDADAPYATKTDVTFAEGDVIVGSKAYNYRFGDYSSWATTLAGPAGIILPAGAMDVARYYVRARVTGVGSITTVPVIKLLRLSTSNMEVTDLGFTEYYGDSRPLRCANIPTANLMATGVAGETAPTSIRLVASTTNNISAILPNSNFQSNVTTTAAYVWTPPQELDTSDLLQVKFHASRSVGAAGNVVIQVDYAISRENDVIGNPNGGAANTVVSSGQQVFPVSATNRGEKDFTVTLPITKVNPATDLFWFKYYRFGAAAADTYNSDIYLHGVELIYRAWSLGTAAPLA